MQPSRAKCRQGMAAPRPSVFHFLVVNILSFIALEEASVFVAVFFFLPFFGQKVNTIIQEVSLLSFTEIAPYLRTAYFAVVIGIIASGILTLALQNVHQAFWVKNKSKISVSLNAVGVLLFIISSQPYAAAFLFIFLAIKVLMLIKWQ